MRLRKIDQHNARLAARGERPIRYQAFRVPSGGLEFDIYALDRSRFADVAALYGRHTRTACRPGVCTY
jgi:hypothetical protein